MKIDPPNKIDHIISKPIFFFFFYLKYQSEIY
jgi:hypothetical protein